MNKYTNYRAPRQTKKALELGAPIKKECFSNTTEDHIFMLFMKDFLAWFLTWFVLSFIGIILTVFLIATCIGFISWDFCYYDMIFHHFVIMLRTSLVLSFLLSGLFTLSEH